MADENRSNDENVTRIAEALLSVRQSAADLSEEQRRDRYRGTLEDELGTLPDAEAEPLVVEACTRMRAGEHVPPDKLRQALDQRRNASVK